MKTNFIPTLLLIAFVAALLGCMNEHTEKASTTPEAIRDAIGGHPDTFGGGLEGWEDGILPEAHWPEIIKDLKPIKVYSHRMNRVIAISQNDDEETGYYVYITISSYLPVSNEKWTFKTIGDNIWSYTRKRGEQDVAPNP